MKSKLHTYSAYSYACAIVWAIALVAVSIRRPQSLKSVSILCSGWWIGWFSATIARSVYPGPKEEKR